MAPHSSTRLENTMDRGAWWATVHGVTKSRTRLSNFTFTCHFHALEKEMAIHSSVLAWRIPRTGEAWWAAVYGVAQSRTRLKRLSSSSSSNSNTKFREGNGKPLQYSCLKKSHGWRSLVGCSPWGLEESDTTERLHFHFSLSCIGEEYGNPLQYSCLENPRDGGAWWAAVYVVAQSQTQLKGLSSSNTKFNSLIHHWSTQPTGLVTEQNV